MAPKKKTTPKESKMVDENITNYLNSYISNTEKKEILPVLIQKNRNKCCDPLDAHQL